MWTAIRTGGQHEHCAHREFPDDRLRIDAELVLDVVVPCDVDGHVAGEAVRYKNAKRHHSLCQLRQSTMETIEIEFIAMFATSRELCSQFFCRQIQCD